VRLEGLGKLKITFTSLGLEPSSICEPIVYTIWDSQQLTFTAYCGDSFALLIAPSDLCISVL
jgi:hypothetical protein